MQRIPVAGLLLVACALSLPWSGCSRKTPPERLPGLHLSYAVDFSAAPGPATSPRVHQQLANAFVGLHDIVLSRLAAAGFADAAVRFDSSSSRLLLHLSRAKREDAERVAQVVAPPPVLEHHLGSAESYVDDAFRTFLASDPAREDSVVVVSDGMDRFVMARGRTLDEERRLLAATLREWRDTPAVRSDAARAALWDRVRIGQSREPRRVAINPEAPELRWRTFLVEREDLLPGGQVAGAERKLDPDAIRDQVFVVLDYSAEGARRLADVTGGNVGRTMVVTVDDVVVFAGTITEPITGGSLRLGFGTGPLEEIARNADTVVDAVAACTAGVRLRQPPLEERWVGP